MTVAQITQPSQASELSSVFDYSVILNQLGIAYHQDNYYLLSGQSPMYKGWILHIAVVVTQIEKLLAEVLPILKDYGVQFKIPANRDFAGAIMDGVLGYEKLAHLVCVYPASDEQAVEIASALITVTAPFKGPKVLTDSYLGGRVYCRHGAHHPVIADNNGIFEEWIQYPDGGMEKEVFTIPFQMPAGIKWPFLAISAPCPYQDIVPDNYKVMSFFKTDAKTSVIKTLYQKNIFSYPWRILKQGKQAMFSDEWGRDITDRLRWQYELHTELQDHIPIPRAYDLFETNGDTFLSMEYVKGMLLDDAVKQLFANTTWLCLPVRSRITLIGYMEQLVDRIAYLHSQGIVHRDINTFNFILRKNEQITLIDVELAYSIKENKPYPPFKQGTPRFMSPQQATYVDPAYEDDIYSLGATLLVMLTGLMPGKFALEHEDVLANQVNFFINDRPMSELISKTLSKSRSSRPSIREIKQGLGSFTDRQHPSWEKTPIIDKAQLHDTINRSIEGLNLEETLAPNGLWHSRRMQDETNFYVQMQEKAIYFGLHTGLSGIMNVIAKLKQHGFDITPVAERYELASQHIHKNRDLIAANLQPGLFYGTAGISISLLNGIKSGLVAPRKDILEFIFTCFNKRITEDDLSIATGMSGQGLALLHSFDDLDKEFATSVLKHLSTTVAQSWDKLSLWGKGKPANQMTPGKNLTLGSGIAGAAYFMFSYGEKFKDAASISVAEKILIPILKKIKQKGKGFVWPVQSKGDTILGLLEGNAGIILTFLKAYEITQNAMYLSIAEKGLALFPKNFLCRDFTMSHGLAGLAYTYTIAYKVTGQGKWKQRSDWITTTLVNVHSQAIKNHLYWEPLPGFEITADYMIGTTGIINYLLMVYEDEFVMPF